ncbi:MAG: flagellar basal body protein FliL [Deltaproteobacteria bacterium HGW-Deltaproteobacteria-10]|nr:MAG: flagellar basal body protein FliL [Deltaproteobacteria bacterium HGW-Deltaproteobacteria-10]
MADKDKKEETEGEEQVTDGKKSSKLKWIIIAVIAVLVLGGGGAGAYFFLFKSKPPAAEKKQAEAAKPQVAVFWPMEPFVVNLIDNEGERYLKVVMQLEVSDAAGLDELNMLKPKIRDSILDLLSSKTFKEMIDPIGKQRLKEEIVLKTNGLLTKGKIIKVYFGEFVIQ